MVFCKDGSEGAFYEQFFEVTKNGMPKEENQNLYLILIIFGIILILLIINQQISEQHILLKIFFYFVIFALISILPNLFFVDDMTLIIQEAINRLVIVFWMYISVFIIYFIFKKFMEWIK